MRFIPRTPNDGVNVSKRHPLRAAVELVAGVVIVGMLVLVALSYLAEFLILRIPPEYEARYFGQGWVDRLVSEPSDFQTTRRLQELTALTRSASASLMIRSRTPSRSPAERFSSPEDCSSLPRPRTS